MYSRKIWQLILLFVLFVIKTNAEQLVKISANQLEKNCNVWTESNDDDIAGSKQWARYYCSKALYLKYTGITCSFVEAKKDAPEEVIIISRFGSRTKKTVENTQFKHICKYSEETQLQNDKLLADRLAQLRDVNPKLSKCVQESADHFYQERETDKKRTEARHEMSDRESDKVNFLASWEIFRYNNCPKTSKDTEIVRVLDMDEQMYQTGYMNCVEGLKDCLKNIPPRE